MILAYKEMTPILFTIIAGTLVCISGGMEIFTGLHNGYAVGTANYIRNFFLLFVTGAVFGKIYQDSLGAAVIADKLAKLFGDKRPLVPLFLASIILSYAGVSGFILIFAIYPIALELFKRANYNKCILPAAFACAAWSVAQLAPGTTQVHNIIPMTYLGTSPMAGALPGFTTAILMALAGYVYLVREAKKLTAQGIVFDSFNEIKRTGDVKEPPFWAAILPIIFVIISFNGFGLRVEISVTIANILAVALMWKQLSFKQWFVTINEGVKSSIVALVNTAVVVGFGAIVTKTPFYDGVLEWIKHADMNPYVFVVVVQTALSGILGTSSGAINLAYETLGPVFRSFAEQGYNIDYIHRLSVQGTGFIETLPHCGALIVAFSVCGMSHKQCYKYVFWSTVVFPGVIIYTVLLPMCMILG
jgi:H+/gluconate symporter-like permease